jgi:hypothetical protein
MTNVPRIPISFFENQIELNCITRLSIGRYFDIGLDTSPVVQFILRQRRLRALHLHCRFGDPLRFASPDSPETSGDGFYGPYLLALRLTLETLLSRPLHALAILKSLGPSLNEISLIYQDMPSNVLVTLLLQHCSAKLEHLTLHCGIQNAFRPSQLKALSNQLKTLSITTLFGAQSDILSSNPSQQCT